MKINIKAALSAGVFVLSSCAIDKIMGVSGEDVIFEEKLSSQAECVIPIALSSRGKVDFQMLRISFVGDYINDFTEANQVIATAIISCREASKPTVFSKNNFSSLVFGDVSVGQGESDILHCGVLRKEDGSHYFDIRASQLTNEKREFNLKVVLSKALPQGTMIRARVFWADGP